MLTGTRESLTEGAIGHAKDSVKSILRFTYYVPIYNVPVRTGVIYVYTFSFMVMSCNSPSTAGHIYPNNESTTVAQCDTQCIEQKYSFALL